ncbi:hypothetical protein [Burkholderia sp. PU8-34]
MTQPQGRQLTNFNIANPIADADQIYVAQGGAGNGVEKAATAAQLATYVQAPIANGSANDAGALTGNETAPLSRGTGLLQTSLTTIATLVIQTLAGFTQIGAGSVSRTPQDKMTDVICVFDKMSFVMQLDVRAGNRAYDHTAAINAAVATGRPVLLPYGDYNYSGELNITQGGLIGEGWGFDNNAKCTRIWFSNLNGVRGGVTTRIATRAQQRPVLRKMWIKGASWDPVTGANANGLDIEAPIDIEDVYVSNFNGYGAYFHNDKSGNGPYQSFMRNLRCDYNAKHGVVVGTGANVLAFINPVAFWNGSPSYGVAPTVAGTADGFHVERDGDGNTGDGSGLYYSYLPESLTVIGGDCSYNANYGWNFKQLFNSGNICPGYAEGNLSASGKQAAIGSAAQNCTIRFAQLAGGAASLDTSAATYTPYWPYLQLWVGGTQVLMSGGGVLQNYSLRASGPAVAQNTMLTDDGSGNWTYLAQNATPDGTTIAASGYNTVATFRGFGNAAFGIGWGSFFLKIAGNFVGLPVRWYQSQGNNWNSPYNLRGSSASMPSSGAFTQGDWFDNSAPSLMGSAPNNYSVRGWTRFTTGSGNASLTDWGTAYTLHVAPGTMVSQNANAVSVTGGTIDGVTIGGITPVPVIGTYLRPTAKYNPSGVGAAGTLEQDSSIPGSRILTGDGTGYQFRVGSRNSSGVVTDYLAITESSGVNFLGAVKLASFVVATLPTVGTNGQIAYASNGRKTGESAGSGTGVIVYYSNSAWRVFSTDAAVAA